MPIALSSKTTSTVGVRCKPNAGSILFSLVLFIRFVIYSKKNKHERFRYYLLRSRDYSAISKKDKLADYLFILKTLNKESKFSDKKISRQLSKRIYYIDNYVYELKLKIKRDENIILEQNILEEFFIDAKASQ